MLPVQGAWVRSLVGELYLLTLPGGLVVRIWRSHCGSPGSIPGQGSLSSSSPPATCRCPRPRPSYHLGLPWWLRGKSVCLECRRPGFDPCIRKIPWRRKWQPTPVLLPGESHGGRSLVGYSPWGRKESDTTKRLHFEI